ncbi:MAG: hypothetical protein KGL39_31060 [Patescibacteria group bacterium]|nr:hypothetical protein [Patescibacteria group bacterium]
MAEMTEEELLNLIAQHEKAALGSPVAAGATVGTTYYNSASTMTTLEIDRFNALNMYFARPLGNEVENSSSYVSPDLRDTIEWIKPQLMRVFVASGTPCVFDPEGEQDVEQAQVETEAVNHVFMKQNPGYDIIHDYITDGMLLRNGYTKTWLEEKQQTKTENYTGLTQDEVTELLADKEDEKVEVLEQREYPVDMPQASMQALQPPTQPGMPRQPLPPVTVFDIKLRRTKKVKHIRVACVPPEEMLVAATAQRNMDECAYACHKTEKPRSDLIDQGYDPDVINSASPGRPNWMEMDALARDVVVDQMSVENPADKSMQALEVRDVAIRVDWDGDGIAELRHVLIVGEKIIENEELEESPFASGVPKRMPHRHTGLSLYDELADIQVIKSELIRQGLNNLRLANNGRTAVDWKNCNLTDLMNSRAGGVVRTNGPPGNVIMPFTHPSNLMEQVLPMIQEVDHWREFRTGVGKDTVGLDADALQNVTKGGQLAGLAAAGLKIEMIARNLAEGLKDTFLKIHALMVRHQDQAMQFQLRGKWVTVNPKDWRERTRVSANVGLGSGTREEARANLMLLEQMQEKIAQMGLIGPKQAYETFVMGAHLLGYEQPERFAMDPSSQEYQQFRQQNPPPPNPAVQAAQIRAQAVTTQAQAGVAKAQSQANADIAKAQAQLAHDAQQNHNQMAHDALQGAQDRQVQMAQQDSAMWQTLVRALAPIIAAQLKQDPSVNAGEVLAQDVRSAGGA